MLNFITCGNFNNKHQQNFQVCMIGWSFGQTWCRLLITCLYVCKDLVQIIYFILLNDDLDLIRSRSYFNLSWSLKMKHTYESSQIKLYLHQTRKYLYTKREKGIDSFNTRFISFFILFLFVHFIIIIYRPTLPFFCVDIQIHRQTYVTLFNINWLYWQNVRVIDQILLLLLL